MSELPAYGDVLLAAEELEVLRRLTGAPELPFNPSAPASSDALEQVSLRVAERALLARELVEVASDRALVVDWVASSFRVLTDAEVLLRVEYDGGAARGRRTATVAAAGVVGVSLCELPRALFRLRFFPAQELVAQTLLAAQEMSGQPLTPSSSVAGEAVELPLGEVRRRVEEDREGAGTVRVVSLPPGAGGPDRAERIAGQLLWWQSAAGPVVIEGAQPTAGEALARLRPVSTGQLGAELAVVVARVLL